MKELSSTYLVVGLGNPGRAYENTRHNIGFHVLEMLAKKYSWSFKDVSSLQGKVAQGVYEGKKVILLLPMTYMNSSGEAARLVMDYFKIHTNNILVVADDVSLPFTSLRIKPSGSSGGHNGLKSIEAHFGSQVYPRMKIGVGAKTFGTLADYVLSKFTEEETKQLPPLLERAAATVEIWIKDGIVKAMQIANSRQEEKKPEQNVGE